MLSIEKYIPGGFDQVNAEKLGYAVLHNVVQGAVTTPHYALVSYLENTLRVGTFATDENILDKKAYIDNTYVVFTNIDGGATEPTNYTWQVEFIDDNLNVDERVVKTYINELESQGSVMYLNTSLDAFDEIHNVALTRLRVSVDLGHASLVMEHQIVELEPDIEELFVGTDEQRLARGGSPHMTRLLGNDFRNYLAEIKDANDQGISDHLIATMLYMHKYKIRPFQNLLTDEKWFSSVDALDQYDFELAGMPFGFFQLYPHVCLFFLKTLRADGTGNEPVFHQDGEEKIQYYVRVLDWFKTFSTPGFTPEQERDKADIMNRMRFPKSCLHLMRELLFLLRRQFSDWKNYNAGQLSEDRTAVEALVSFLQLGPYHIFNSPTSFSKSIYNKQYTPYITKILEVRDPIEYAFVRVRVLDVRSGEPVKNSRVRKLIVKANAANTGYDAEFPSDSVNYTSLNNIKNSQRALNALGYDTGTPGNSYGNQGRQAFNNYWAARDASVTPVTSGNPPRTLRALIVKEYNAHRATDSHGTLTIRMPLALFNGNTIKIYVSFWDFPTALEALKVNATGNPISRSANAGEIPGEGTTGFNVQWLGQESLQIKDYAEYYDGVNYNLNSNFGWRVFENTMQSHFKVLQELVVKTDNGDYNGIDPNLASKYYEHVNTPYHFVLFAMQWCQPVWDEFPDSPNPVRGSISPNTYVNDPDLANRRMHIVTGYFTLAGSRPYGGKGYGLVNYANNAANSPSKWRGGAGHRGADIHAVVGALLFATHGGTLSLTLKPPGTPAPHHEKWKRGRYITLSWTGRAMSYLHLSRFPDGETDADVIAGNVDDKLVMAGQIVGYAGRSGNFNPQAQYLSSTHPTKWPGHVHLNITASGGDVVGLRTAPDTDNQVVIPYNEVPLVLPCQVQVTNPAHSPRNNCSFENATFYRTCWAVAELKCPYISSKPQTNPQRIQAQLRYLNEKPTAVNQFFQKDNHAEFDNPGKLANRVHPPNPNKVIYVIDGVLGEMVFGGHINLSAGDMVTRDKRDDADNTWRDNSGNPKYRRVSYNGMIGWLEHDDLDWQGEESNQYELKVDIEWLLPGGKDRKRDISKTRKAIYTAREQFTRADGSNYLEDGNESNGENYKAEAGTDFLNKLNLEAVPTVPNPPAP